MGCGASTKSPEQKNALSEKEKIPPQSAPQENLLFEPREDYVHLEEKKLDPAEIYGAELSDKVAETGADPSPSTHQAVANPTAPPQTPPPIHDTGTEPSTHQPFHDTGTEPSTHQPFHDAGTEPSTHQPFHDTETEPSTHQPFHDTRTEPSIHQPFHDTGTDPSTQQHVYDVLTVELLNEFIELDKEIQELESKHTEEMLTLHRTEYMNIEQAFKITQSELYELKNNVVDEEASSLNCSQYMQSQSLSIMADGEGLQIQETLNVIEAKNRHEVCEKQLEALQDKLHQISEAVEKSLQQVDTLTQKRLRLNGLLENVFNGEYGSEMENRYELETDQLLQKKQHISVAHFKWWNGRYLINHAVTQMALVCRRWKDIQMCAVHNEMQRYGLATDARNNLVAAQQNCLRAEEYLNMPIPYWTTTEKQNILGSINVLYTDLTSSYSYEKAYSWFYYYHQRLGLQLNWMDQVINNKIVADYKRVSQEFKVKYRELRTERLRLIQEKAKELLNIDWNIELFLATSTTEHDETDTLPMVPIVDTNTNVNEDTPTGDNTELGLPKPSEEITQSSEEIPKPSEETHINNDNIPTSPTADGGNSGENITGPPPMKRLSLTQLAPTPSDNELFGNVQQLEETHRKQMEEFDKVQEVNRAKQQQGLKEKLRERQSKRRKQMLQQMQETALSDVSSAQ